MVNAPLAALVAGDETRLSGETRNAPIHRYGGGVLGHLEKLNFTQQAEESL